MTKAKKSVKAAKSTKQKQPQRVFFITVPKRRHLKLLEAVAAFNGIGPSECASRMLATELQSLHEEINFRGALTV